MTHRDDVQILRGIAVLLVVLFHIGLTDFGSGFLGVDVFFVISGYLMARMYDPRKPGQFFRRRARRLLPAYFGTIVATLMAALVLTTPNELDQVIDQAWYAVLFSSNIGFWAANSYFDKAEFKPLLHLWSLGVEIQFYALVPLLALFVRRLKLGGLIVLALASAALCFVVASVSAKTAFFWLPTRAWEFLLGYGVATVLGPRLAWRRSARTIEPASPVGVVGLLAILAIALLPIRGDQGGFVLGHPGLAALGISLATALVIAVGLPRRLYRSLPGRSLARLGDWSYSIYLAHYPAIVFVLYQPFSGTVTTPSTPADMAATLAAIVIASWLLFRLVERPLRPAPLGRPSLITASLAVVILAIPAATLKEWSLSAHDRSIFAARTDRDQYRCGTAWRILNPTALTCPLNSPANVDRTILLVGNSHADSMKHALTEIANAHQVRVHLTVENAPLMSTGRLGPRDVVDLAASLQASTIILHYSPGAIPVATVEAVAAEASSRAIGVSYLMPVPKATGHVPRKLWAATRTGQPAELISLADYQAEHREQLARLKTIQTRGFRLYEVAADFCRPRCEISNAAGVPFYFDDHHLTLTGSRLLEPTLERLVDDLLVTPPAAQPWPTKYAVNRS